MNGSKWGDNAHPVLTGFNGVSGGGMNMKIKQYIRAIAGSFILLSLLLAYVHSNYWLWFTTFVGFNLLQSAFTKWCLMEILLEKLGVPPSC